MTETQANVPDSVEPVSLRGPYLKVFSSIDGCFDYDLSADRTTIGRAEESDIRFDDSTVSRNHAVIVRDGDRFVIKDLGSYQGTQVRGKSVTRHVLEDGDCVQISMHVLQFKTQTVEAVARRVSLKARRLLAREFHPLPSTMQLSYRFVDTGSYRLFSAGDTIVVGKGGLLIPARQPPDDALCVELRLIWPDGREKRLLGEVLGVIDDEGLDWMCVKLHRATKGLVEKLAETATPGQWIPVQT